MTKRKFLGASVLLGSLIVGFSSCDKDDDVPSYTVPDTYSFTNVEYSEASGRVSMWAGINSYLGKSTTRQLSADTATYIWNNTNNAFTAEISSNLPFSVAAINALGFGVSGKSADQALYKQYIDSMVKISEFYTATASPGNPGKVNNSRLVNYAGVEFNQLVAKGLMGALQLNQVILHLDKSMTDDNNTVTPGKGTAMQHDWDLAFGYVGIPANYDSSLAYANTEPNRPLALGGYFRERGRFIQSGGKVYEAFRKGRAAIDAKDYPRRNEAINTIKLELEKTIAAAAFEYAKIAKGSGDLAVKFHALSEAYGFMLALKYRATNSPLTGANYTTAMDLIKTDFYVLAADATHAKLNQLQTILTTAYGQLQAS